MNKQEMLDKMLKSRSWKEFGISIQEVCNALVNDENVTKTVPNQSNESDELKMLREKVERLSETNKKLREENKALKGKK